MQDKSKRRRFVRGAKVSPTPQDDGFLERAQISLGRPQGIMESGNLLLKQHFGLVPLRRERIQRIGKAVVKHSQ